MLLLLKGCSSRLFSLYESRAIVLQVSKQDALDLQTLTAYITYARQHINPTLSDEAADDLINGYVEMRQKGNFPGSSKKVQLLQMRIRVDSSNSK